MTKRKSRKGDPPAFQYEEKEKSDGLVSEQRGEEINTNPHTSQSLIRRLVEARYSLLRRSAAAKSSRRVL